MTEEELIASLRARWPRERADSSRSAELMAFADDGVRAFPNSAILWRIRGDLIQLLETPYPLKEVERSYRLSIKAHAFYADAYEELGRFLNVVMKNPRKAKRFLDKAGRLRKIARTKHLLTT